MNYRGKELNALIMYSFSIFFTDLNVFALRMIDALMIVNTSVMQAFVKGGRNPKCSLLNSLLPQLTRKLVLPLAQTKESTD